MSDAALDRGVYFSSSMTDWYRERPFKVAFAVSVVIHAVLIAFIPGFRSIPAETPRVLEVEIAPQEMPPPPIQEKPVVQRKAVEPIPEPVVRQPQPEPPPILRADVIRAPRAEPKPEFVVPKPELRPEPKAEPRLEARPEPKIEPRPEPPPVARVEPRPEPPPVPVVEPRPEPRLEPRTEVRPEVKPVPSETPPPVVQPGIEPSVVAPTVARPASPVTVPPPPVVAPQPKAADESRDRTLIEQYQQIISARIKQYEEYPPVAKRRHWEGTTVVQLRLGPDGKVTDISVVEKSGYEVLDEAAVKMIRKASPLPLPPEGLRGRDHTVLVPIKFRLDS